MFSRDFLEGCVPATLGPEDKRQSAVCQHWGVPSTHCVFTSGLSTFKNESSNSLLPLREELSLLPVLVGEIPEAQCVCFP